MSEHITEPPAYDKPVNQSPCAIARELLNRAENTPHHVTVVNAATINPGVAAALGFEAIRAGTVKASGFGIKDCHRLVVELPDLPAGTQVEPFAFNITRGDAKVRIVRTDNGAWHVDQHLHEAQQLDYNFAYTNPTLHEWQQKVYRQRFTDPKGAIELANAWLDALDSWHTSAEAGRMSMENRLSGLLD